MFYSHISIGGGITGIQTIISSYSNIKKKLLKHPKKIKKLKSKTISFLVIEKSPKNIPGGVAYSFDLSRYGYFNNPLRLSPDSFCSWLTRNKNKSKIIDYLKVYGGYSGCAWIEKNSNSLLFGNKKEINELYLPRVIMNFWMEEKLIDLIVDMKKLSKKLSINFKIDFYKGKVVSIKKNKNNFWQVILEKNVCSKIKYKIVNNKFKKLNFNELKKEKKYFFSKSQVIGLGLPPPKQLATRKAQKSNFYIWDFYKEGSTSLLLKKILVLLKKRSKLRLYFIGFKAGLLESLPELNKVIINKKLNIEILCSSSDLQSVQKAELSLLRKKYRLILFNKHNIKKIKTAKNLYSNLIKEFKLSILNGYNKYDVWTLILKDKILSKCINRFSKNEKKKYNDIFHHKIRNITRFTYPETIFARENLLNLNRLKTNKEKVKKVDFIKNKILVFTENNNKKIKRYICDLAINVSGPLSAKNIKNEIPLVSSLKKNGAKIEIDGGFSVDNNFRILGMDNIYMPGILARGFNPERKTIINSILENSEICGKSISDQIVNSC